jgi:branched-subunit amino acid aminotransferase/4-amino-4-deoxychorismate lyase
LVNNGQINLIRFSGHQARFDEGCAYYHLNSTMPTIKEISEFCRINLASTARLRISCFKYPPSAITYTSMEIFPYTIDTTPVSLMLSTQPFTPPLEVTTAGIKTINYIKYHQMLHQATEAGYWDQILYDEKHQLLETGRANIYFYIDSEWYTPESNIIKGTIRALLVKKGVVKPRKLTIFDLQDVSVIAVSNALNSIREVHKVEKMPKEIVWLQKNPNISQKIVEKLNQLLEKDSF